MDLRTPPPNRVRLSPGADTGRGREWGTFLASLWHRARKERGCPLPEERSGFGLGGCAGGTGCPPRFGRSLRATGETGLGPGSRAGMREPDQKGRGLGGCTKLELDTGPPAVGPSRGAPACGRWD